MIFVLLSACITSACGLTWTYTNKWNGGCQGEFHVYPEQEIHGWQATLAFDSDVKSLEVVMTIFSHSIFLALGLLNVQC